MMRSRTEDTKEKVDKALFKLMKASAADESEAKEMYMKDIDLENFSRLIVRLVRDIENLDDRLVDLQRDELSDLLNQSGCCCCCCGGCK